MKNVVDQPMESQWNGDIERKGGHHNMFMIASTHISEDC
jgi:hypothetical protein